MSGVVELKSGSTSMILGPINGEYISIMFESGDIKAKIVSYLYTDYQDYYRYFQNIADSWKGWQGSKKWQTVEGDFQLEATHDSQSYVFLKLTLIKNQGIEDEWVLNGRIKIDLGQLDGIANEIKQTLPQGHEDLGP